MPKHVTIKSVEHIRANWKMYAPNFGFDHFWIVSCVSETMMREGVRNIQINIYSKFTVIKSEEVWLHQARGEPSDLMHRFFYYNKPEPNSVRGELIAAAFSRWCCVAAHGELCFSNNNLSDLERKEVEVSINSFIEDEVAFIISKELLQVDCTPDLIQG